MVKIKSFCVVNNNTLATLLEDIQVQHEDRLVGGYVWIGRVGIWNGVLITTTDTQLYIWDTASGNGGLILATMTSDSRDELAVDVDTDTLQKINTWLQARGFLVETRAKNRTILRKLYRRLQADFEF